MGHHIFHVAQCTQIYTSSLGTKKQGIRMEFHKREIQGGLKDQMEGEKFRLQYIVRSLWINIMIACSFHKKKSNL